MESEEIVDGVNEQDKSSDPAPFWRIRVGELDRDTSHAVSAILALSLGMAGCKVDIAYPWASPMRAITTYVNCSIGSTESENSDNLSFPEREIMETLALFLEDLLNNAVLICTLLMEFLGVCVLVSTAVRSFWHWIRKDGNNIRLSLAQGIALALEFKMGGEVLRTVIVREWAELGILGAIILLRGLLTFLIHWEIENERKLMKKD